MNEKNNLETRLRSWTPRRPSPGLERRIFDGRTASKPGEGRRHPWPALPAFASLLAPAAACLLLAAGVLTHSGPLTNAVRSEREALAAMSVSNQSFAAYLPGSFQLSANRLDTFGWTNGAGFNSPMDSLSPKEAT